MTHFRAISMIVFITFLAIGCGSSGGGGDIVGGDNDGDGFTESQGDCNNSNAGINPGASEICGDGIDQDCNGIDVICTLSVPANVQATAGEGTITVSWDVASYADSYYVYWSTTQDDGTNGKAIAVTGTRQLGSKPKQKQDKPNQTEERRWEKKHHNPSQRKERMWKTRNQRYRFQPTWHFQNW